MGIVLTLFLPSTSQDNSEKARAVTIMDDGSIIIRFLTKISAMQAVRKVRDYGFSEAIGVGTGNNEYEVHMWGAIDGTNSLHNLC